MEKSTAIEIVAKELQKGFEAGKISEDLLNKSLEELDLLKGGEGSRGGKVIGHDENGKAIYAKKDGIDYKAKAEHHKQKFVDAKLKNDSAGEEKHRKLHAKYSALAKDQE